MADKYDRYGHYYFKRWLLKWFVIYSLGTRRREADPGRIRNMGREWLEAEARVIGSSW